MINNLKTVYISSDKALFKDKYTNITDKSSLINDKKSVKKSNFCENKKVIKL